MLVAMLTTEDNPFDPFDDFPNWWAWDSRAGYHTPGLLARYLHLSEDLSEYDQQMIINQAVEEVVEMNLSGKHKAVYRDD